MWTSGVLVSHRWRGCTAPHPLSQGCPSSCNAPVPWCRSSNDKERRIVSSQKTIPAPWQWRQLSIAQSSYSHCAVLQQHVGGSHGVWKPSSGATQRRTRRLSGGADSEKSAANLDSHSFPSMHKLGAPVTIERRKNTNTDARIRTQAVAGRPDQIILHTKYEFFSSPVALRTFYSMDLSACHLQSTNVHTQSPSFTRPYTSESIASPVQYTVQSIATSICSSMTWSVVPNHCTNRTSFLLDGSVCC